MHGKTMATTERALRTVKQVALDLNVPKYEALELIVSGNKNAVELSANAYKKFKE